MKMNLVLLVFFIIQLSIIKSLILMNLLLTLLSYSFYYYDSLYIGAYSFEKDYFLPLINIDY